MATPESKIKAIVKRRLEKEYHFSEPSSCYQFCPVQNGMGAPGLDFFLCIHGKFFAIETKKRGVGFTSWEANDLKATDRQLVTMNQVRSAGGAAYVVDNEESLEEAITDINRRI